MFLNALEAEMSNIRRSGCVLGCRWGKTVQLDYVCYEWPDVLSALAATGLSFIGAHGMDTMTAMAINQCTILAPGLFAAHGGKITRVTATLDGDICVPVNDDLTPKGSNGERVRQYVVRRNEAMAVLGVEHRELFGDVNGH